MTDLSNTRAFAGFGEAAQNFLDAMIAMQETCIETLEQASKSMKSPFPTNGDLKSAKAFFMPELNENKMREAFHQMANTNLRGWEQAANLWQATPEWMRWPHTEPGSMLTEWFDRANRATKKTIEDAAAVIDVPVAETTAPAPIDDLTLIKGVGPKMSKALINSGVTSFAQIAEWTSKDISAVENTLASKGRVAREKWVSQAKKLAKAKR